MNFCVMNLDAFVLTHLKVLLLCASNISDCENLKTLYTVSNLYIIALYCEVKLELLGSEV